MSACVQCREVTVPVAECQCMRGDDSISWITMCGFYFCGTAWVIGTYERDSLLKSGSIFPFNSSCSYLVALHFSFGHATSFSEFFKLAAKIHQRIFNLCVLAAAFVRSPKGKYAPTRCEKEKKKTVFSSAAALEGQRWLRASTSVPYRLLSWGTFYLHTSANRCKNTFFPSAHFPKRSDHTHWNTSWKQKKENKVNVSLLFQQYSSSFSLFTMFDVWKRQMGGGEVDDKQVLQVINRRGS